MRKRVNSFTYYTRMRFIYVRVLLQKCVIKHPQQTQFDSEEKTCAQESETNKHDLLDPVLVLSD